MFSSVFVPLVLAASALANVFITNPVSSSTLTAGQQVSVTWQDSGSAPTLSQFGNATFAVYTGNSIQQTLLQTFGTFINVSAIASIPFTPNASIGPDGDYYFIRVTSLSYKDSSGTFAEAFSSLFTLQGMSGSFNSTIQDEINGQSTAPIGGTMTSTMPPATASQAATTAAPKSSPASAAASASASAKATNGAGKHAVIAGPAVALVAALIGVSLF